MIPDVLADCRARLTYYLAEYGTLYAPWRGDLEALLAEMARVQQLVTNPFFGLDEEDTP